MRLESVQVFPHVGAGALLLGGSRQDAEAVIGPSNAPSMRTARGRVQWHYESLILAFSSAGVLEEICLLPLSDARLGNIHLFRDSSVLEKLWLVDQSAYEQVGFVNFPELALALVDFLDGDPSSRTVLVCSKGALDIRGSGRSFEGRGVKVVQ